MSLNLCMSYQCSQKIIDRLSQDHHIEVQFCSDELKTAFLDKKVTLYTVLLLELHEVGKNTDFWVLGLLFAM